VEQAGILSEHDILDVVETVLDPPVPALVAE